MVLQLSTEVPEVEAPREDLFAIDGKMFTIPVEVPAAEGIRYLNDVRRGGVEYAVSCLMERMVGEEGMQKLGRTTNMRPEDFKSLIKHVQGKVNKMMEDSGLGN